MKATCRPIIRKMRISFLPMVSLLFMNTLMACAHHQRTKIGDPESFFRK